MVARQEALARPVRVERGHDARVVERSPAHPADVEGRDGLVERAPDSEGVVGRLRHAEQMAIAVARRTGEVGIERREAQRRWLVTVPRGDAASTVHGAGGLRDVGEPIDGRRRRGLRRRAVERPRRGRAMAAGGDRHRRSTPWSAAARHVPASWPRSRGAVPRHRPPRRPRRRRCDAARGAAGSPRGDRGPGNLPSARPGTKTVANSRPLALWTVSTEMASAGLRPGRPGRGRRRPPALRDGRPATAAGRPARGGPPSARPRRSRRHPPGRHPRPRMTRPAAAAGRCGGGGRTAARPPSADGSGRWPPGSRPRIDPAALDHRRRDGPTPAARRAPRRSPRVRTRRRRERSRMALMPGPPRPYGLAVATA